MRPDPLSTVRNTAIQTDQPASGQQLNAAEFVSVHAGVTKRFADAAVLQPTDEKTTRQKNAVLLQQMFPLRQLSFAQESVEPVAPLCYSLPSVGQRIPSRVLRLDRISVWKWKRDFLNGKEGQGAHFTSLHMFTAEISKKCGSLYSACGAKHL